MLECIRVHSLHDSEINIISCPKPKIIIMNINYHNYVKYYSKSDFLCGDIVRFIRYKEFKVRDIEFLIERLINNY